MSVMGLMSVNYVNLAGLVFDIVGAVLLGRAVAFNSREKIAQQVATAWGFNKQLIPHVVEGRLEAVTGLMILVAGFMIQGASQFYAGDLLTALLIVCVLAVALLAYKLAFSRLQNEWTKDVIDFIEQRQSKRT